MLVPGEPLCSGQPLLNGLSPYVSCGATKTDDDDDGHLAGVGCNINFRCPTSFCSIREHPNSSTKVLSTSEKWGS